MRDSARWHVRLCPPACAALPGGSDSCSARAVQPEIGTSAIPLHYLDEARVVLAGMEDTNNEASVAFKIEQQAIAHEDSFPIPEPIQPEFSV